MRRLVVCLAFQVTVASFAPSVAHAQTDDILITPSLPPDYDRGRNVSVVERPRPDYDPLGIPLGPFNALPSISAGVGASNNVFLDSNGKRSDAFVFVNPAVRLNSDWSRHQVQARASGAFTRYLSQTERNENAFSLGLLGRFDVARAYAVTAEVQASRQSESPLTGEIESDVSVLSRYTRAMGSLRGTYTSGKVRLLAAVDRTSFAFSNIKRPNGTVVDQSDRDRIILRASGQAQYALTPSASVYGQLTYGDTNYDSNLLSGAANRDSNNIRIIGGLNFDLSGLMRGTIGVGYIWRNYDAPIYGDVSGFSVEGKLQYFVSQLTDTTLGVRRIIEDSSLGNSNAYYDNRIYLRVDHELLRNLILNAQADLAYQDYIGIDRNNVVYRLGLGGRYLSSRKLGLSFDLSYGGRNASGAGTGRTFNELRGMIGVVLQR